MPKNIFKYFIPEFVYQALQGVSVTMNVTDDIEPWIVIEDFFPF